MRIRLNLLILLTLSSSIVASGQVGVELQTSEVAGRIDEILERPAAKRAFWGIHIVNLKTGDVVYERNADKLFVPASNAKIYSTALALRRLGADYRYTTDVVSDGVLDRNGVLTSDLRLLGGGDPNLSSRVIPYDRRREYTPDRLKPLDELAKAAYEAGLRRVRGDLIGDDSRYVWQPYPRGWSQGDTLNGYGSAVSALVFNDNRIEYQVRPGVGPGRPARVRIVPPIEHYNVTNRSATASTRTVSNRLDVRRGSQPAELVIFGKIPQRSRGRSFELAAANPALYAAQALERALGEYGIEVDGEIRAEHLLPDGLRNLKQLPPRAQPRSFATKLASRTSPVLAEAIRVVNKESLNLHAEMFLREVAFRERNVGSDQAAIESMRDFLEEVGLSPGEFFLRDGSGLSRHNLVTPAGTVKLLAYMWNTPDRQTYLESFPIAGRDGTLDWRFSRTPARGRILAKTGTLSHVTALSGYIATADEQPYAFSIFVNNFGTSSSYMRSLVDRIAAAVVTTTESPTD